MQIETISVRQAIDNAFLQESITEADFELFRRRLLKLLNQADDAVAEGESEEHLKNLLKPFFSSTNFEEDYYINTKEQQDLAIHNGKTRKSKVGVIIEAKRPSNKAEMITGEDLNRKAFHESILYYLRERIDNGNEDIKHIIITDVYHWYVFDAQDFERHFYESKKLTGWYEQWKQGQKVSSRTQFVYDHLSGFVDELDANMKAAALDISRYRKLLEKPELSRDEQKKLVPIFKLFTPTHLLKQPFASDSNELNRSFYRELLYIMGLKEYKEKGTHYITRLDEDKRQHASLIENVITQLKSMSVLSRLPNKSEYGEDEQEQLFNVAIQLLITWINRILFLKLLEAQLYKYHREDERFRFLRHNEIKEYDGLNKLFFQVLAVPYEDRSDRINKHYGHIPYLNSSLFDVAEIEAETIAISALEDGLNMPVYGKSKIRDRDGQPLKGEELSTLEYLLRFLDAYNFNTEGTAEVQKEAKTLINASVLGRIFEKINGYKDGSFFTPGYITEYMCKKTIRRAVVQKFNEAYEDWDCESIEEVAAKISRHEVPYEEANRIVNSITVCDPAVGSGHFLVSALNELIAIKSDLRIFVDENDHRIRDVEISVDNDELTISVGQDPFFEYRVFSEWKQDGRIERTVGSDTQRLQRALFREKNILIENCLFGVDINPNSVNICRLRLWIELLKHAYYREDTDFQALEVLPNIDINIKQGNSLVSRFNLDADLSQILANNDDLTIEEYKQAVRSYKETGDREDKRALKEQIKSIKDNFEAGLKEQHEVRQELKKQEEILIREETKLDLFEGEKKSKKEQKKITKTKKKIGKLEEELEELENATFYDQAFEWRFEFPEVLDGDGNFTGFDAVIGNPPYGVTFSNDEKEYFKSNYESIVGKYDSYGFFIEKSIRLLKNKGQIGFIVPHTWLTVLEAKSLRKFLYYNTKLNEFIKLPSNVFEEAVVEPINMILQKESEEEVRNRNQIQAVLFDEGISLDRIDKNQGELHSYKQESWGSDHKFNIYLSDQEQKILEKLRSDSLKLVEICDFSVGIQAYDSYTGQERQLIDKRVYHSDQKEDETYVKELNGKDIDRYKYQWPGSSWISYGDWLAHPRSKKYFDRPRILVREITAKGKYKIKACYVEEYMVNYKSVLNIILQENAKKAGYETHFVLGLINSALMSWYFPRASNKLVTSTFPRISIHDLKKFPFPATTLDFEKRRHIHDSISRKAEEITNLSGDESFDAKIINKEIDQLVYELYGLNEEEIGIVEENLEK